MKVKTNLLIVLFVLIAASFVFSGCVTGQAKGGVKGAPSDKELTECNDGIDNDGDVYIDYQFITEGKGKNKVETYVGDLGCTSEDDNDESNNGDGVCEEDFGETCETAPEDCGSCFIECSDTDEGIDFTTKGFVSGTWDDGDIADNQPDVCGGDILNEYYCNSSNDEGYIQMILHTCPNGCEDGACVEESTCVDSDNTIDINNNPPNSSDPNKNTYPSLFVKGYVTNSEGLVYEDKCSHNETRVEEWFCSGGQPFRYYPYCSNGCVDGACVEEEPDYCTLVLDNSTYELYPCELNTSMVDGAGNVDFKFHIIQRGAPVSYGFSVYGYGEGFPTYGTIGTSSGGAQGNTTISRYFNDDYLNFDPSNPVYSGYLPIKIYHGSASGNDPELRFNINLGMLPEEQVFFTCDDTDSGQDYGNFGVVYGLMNGIGYNITDYCLDNMTLVENYCSGDFVKTTYYDCMQDQNYDYCEYNMGRCAKFEG